MDLNLLVVLHHLLETRSVAKSAAALRLTPSAVSHALARLRRAFGDELFVRSSEGLVPTRRAEAVSAQIAGALRDLEGAVTSPGFAPAAARLTFTIATTDFGALQLLPALLAELEREAPGVVVLVRPLPTEPRAALEDGEVDAMIGVLEGAPPALFKRKLFVERSRVLARRDHPMVRRGKLALSDYLAARHILIAPRGGSGSPVDRHLATLGHARRIATRIPYFVVAPALVAASDLLLTAGERLLETAAQERAVESVPLPFEMPSYTISLVWHARSHEDPAQAWLRERLIAANGRAYAAAGSAT